MRQKIVSWFKQDSKYGPNWLVVLTVLGLIYGLIVGGPINEWYYPSR